MRTDGSNHLFWERYIKEAKDLEIGEVLLPRKRQRPLRYYFGNAPVEFLDSVENHCRSIYNDYTTYYSKLESLLLCSAKGESCEELLSFVCNFYKDDFDKHKLETQLASLPGMFEDKEVTDIHMVVKKFQKISAGVRAHFSEVFILIKLLLIAPATNAVSERSCSTLRRIKTYLRTRMI